MAVAAILKMVSSLYFSAGNHPISAQFSVQPQVTLPRTVTRQSATILKIQHGRRQP